MRAQQKYIITKDEVYGYADSWLEKPLKFQYRGTKCNVDTLLRVLLLAAVRVTNSLLREVFQPELKTG